MNLSFFAPKLAHRWAQTVGAKTEWTVHFLLLLNIATSVNATKIRLIAIWWSGQYSQDIVAAIEKCESLFFLLISSGIKKKADVEKLFLLTILWDIVIWAYVRRKSALTKTKKAVYGQLIWKKCREKKEESMVFLLTIMRKV